LRNAAKCIHGLFVIALSFGNKHKNDDAPNKKIDDGHNPQRPVGTQPELPLYFRFPGGLFFQMWHGNSAIESRALKKPRHHMTARPLNPRS